ncbi:hypothetical protein POM88_012350 [Heracleum sosnowskyi]|uniref:Micronuclear linker histone polyprotein-like protein n=1 Tax=Heracleum sosnowskyi TaxID=360622 RepID=A0AAD8IWB4_9APIA|nr:hypothetical protein POM88_012350 [Heracleum sosnowskyi]
MGVGGGLKGHSTQNSSGSGRAGRPYGWMLLLFIAFGALLFGVIALHKLRERRVFDLVIKDKDLQLHSLHSHLQKERDFAKEAKRKSDELKSELKTLRNQKSELSGKISQMQSTISSLKEEHKAIESALEEKQNEIDLMKKREKLVNEQNRRGSLAKVLSLKEAEFEDLKRNLELPVRNWDINFKYPNSAVNLTTRSGIARMDETVGTDKQNGGQLHTYNKIAGGENGEDRRETENVAFSRKISGEEPHILKGSPQEFLHKNTTDESHGERMSYKLSKDGALNIDTQKSNTNGTEAKANTVVDFEKVKDVDGATLARNSKFGNNGQEKNVIGSAKGKRFFRNERDGKQKKGQGETELLGVDIRTASNENDAKSKLFNPVLWKEGKETKGDTITESESKIKKYHSSSVLKSHMNSKNGIPESVFQLANEVQVNRNINEPGSKVTSEDREKKPKEIVHPEAQANEKTHRTERSGNDKAANPKKRNIAKNTDIADWEVDNIHELDAHNLAVKL